MPKEGVQNSGLSTKEQNRQGREEEESQCMDCEATRLSCACHSQWKDLNLDSSEGVKGKVGTTVAPTHKNSHRARRQSKFCRGGDLPPFSPTSLLIP